MNAEEIGCARVDWIDLARGWVQW